MAKLNREAWLTAVATELEALFTQRGVKLPKYRVTCGWPSSKALSAANRRIGECWSDKASADGRHEIIVSMCLTDPMRVAGVMAHEMVHAAVGIPAGHKKPFRDLAVSIGLEGKMTATTEGDVFKKAVRPMLKRVGRYPHGQLDATLSGRKKQTTRMLKASCPECGYTVRTTAKWIEVAVPTCPDADCEHYGGPMEVS